MNIRIAGLLLAIEKYKSGEASLGRSAKLAGRPVRQMMTTLEQFGVENRIEDNDYVQSLKNLRDVL